MEGCVSAVVVFWLERSGKQGYSFYIYIIETMYVGLLGKPILFVESVQPFCSIGCIGQADPSIRFTLHIYIDRNAKSDLPD